MGQKFAPISDHERAICERFKTAREDAGITQERIGMHVGLSRDQVASIEAARVALRFWPGWKFCVELDVNAVWLAYGEEPFRPCVDYFKQWMSPPALENDPEILFSGGFQEIEDRYRSEYRVTGYVKRAGGGLRKELARPVHASAAPHKAALSVLIDAWFSDLTPANRNSFIAHLCKAAEDFKSSVRKGSKSEKSRP